LESKNTFLILIIIVAVLTLTLFALAAYIFLVQGTSDGKVEAVSNTTDVSKGIPVKENRIMIALFEDKRIYNLKDDGTDKIAMMQVAVSLDCYKQLKENKKVIVADRITAYSVEIQELVVRFFLTKTINEVKDVAVMDNAKVELTKKINDLLNQGEKYPEDIVYNVIFSEWIFQ
jgi:flagellar basal body-associated protein FliL